MASPAPTYAADLVMVSQEILSTVSTHLSYVTYACDYGSYGSTPNNAMADAKSAYETAWTAVHGTNVRISTSFGKFGLGTTAPVVGTSSAAQTSGTRAGTMPSAQVALGVSKKTALAGRKNQGRVYLPWAFLESEVDEAGRISSTILDDLQAAADLWLSTLAGFDLPMVIAQRALANNPTPPPAKYVSAFVKGPDVTALVVKTYCRTQRRRLDL